MRLTRNALKDFKAPDEADTNTQVERVAELLPNRGNELSESDVSQNTLISKILGEGILDNPGKVHAILRARRECAAELVHFRESSINMGRIFLDVKNALNDGEFSLLMRSAPEIFHGLNRSTVLKLIAVSELWDNAIVPHDQAPQHYSTLYEFTTLKPAVFRLAVEEHIFRPDVTRAEITRWKRRKQQTVDQPQPEPSDQLCAELENLAKKRALLLIEVLKVRKKMGEIRVTIAERAKTPSD